MSDHVRLFVSFPEDLVDRPMIYEVVKRFDVVPNIRRANVEAHSGWVILELHRDTQTLEDVFRHLTIGDERRNRQLGRPKDDQLSASAEEEDEDEEDEDEDESEEDESDDSDDGDGDETPRSRGKR